MDWQAIEIPDGRARVVGGGNGYVSRQGTHYLPGVSAETTGATAIWLGIVTLGAGQRTFAHIHEKHETAFYLMSGGEIELWSGARLEHCDRAGPGDYLFIPAGLPHVAVNRGTEAAVFVGGRNEATAQESMVLMPELDGLVP